jgi:transcriptional regulator with XRE-family HTH domain
MTAQAPNEYAQRLGAEIRNRRMTRGMSLRALAKQLNLSGHGTLVDYEHGRRIPPENLVVGCERIFEISAGALSNLREKALAERAGHNTEQMLRASREEPALEPQSEPDPEPLPEPLPEPKRRRFVPRWAVITGAAVVLAAGAGIGIWQWGSPAAKPAPAAPVHFGFEDGIERWSPLWGGDRIEYQVTSAVAFEGHQSLQITTTGTSNNADKSIGITHQLETLHPGMKVTFYLRVPVQQPASIRFFAQNSGYDPIWAPETPGPGDEIPLPADTDWKQYTWTVPAVDRVRAIGMEVYQNSAKPVIIWIDAVGW